MRPSSRPAHPSRRVRHHRGAMSKALVIALFALLLLNIVLAIGSQRYRDMVTGVFKSSPAPTPTPANDEPGTADPIERDGRRYLHGGDDDAMDFDITNWVELEAGGLEYGFGREAWLGIWEPQFTTIEDAASWMNEDGELILDEGDFTLVLDAPDGPRIYPVPLIEYRMVNDRVGETPVLVYHDLMNNILTVYERSYAEDRTLTFGFAGFAYVEIGVLEEMTALLIWDRDTESLWWPAMGRAIAGPLRGLPMRRFTGAPWYHATWGEAIARFPDAKVLQRGQFYPRPVEWETQDWVAAELGEPIAYDAETPVESAPARWGDPVAALPDVAAAEDGDGDADGDGGG
ncbi:MAG: DUF3179 domain-containing (seleno)protein [Phycisphaerales bacterium]